MITEDLVLAFVLQYDSVIIERRPKVVTVLLHATSGEYCVGKLGRHDTKYDIGERHRERTHCHVFRFLHLNIVS